MSDPYGIFGGLVTCYLAIVIGIILFILFIIWAVTRTPTINVYHQPPPQNIQPSFSVQVKYCPNCRTQNPYNASFCIECGYKF
jgi:hypothetical protein